jgi:hypothetical protein
LPLPKPQEGRKPQGLEDRRLENEEIQERDHGLANPTYGEKMQSRNLEDVKVRTLAADTIQQPTHAPT